MWPETAAALKHFDAVIGSLITFSDNLSLQNDARLQEVDSSLVSDGRLSSYTKSDLTDSTSTTKTTDNDVYETRCYPHSKNTSKNVLKKNQDYEPRTDKSATSKGHVACAVSSHHTVILPGKVHVKDLSERQGVDIKFSMQDHEGKPLKVRAHCPKKGSGTAWVQRYKSHGH
ncbi:hypothetical protein AAVH_01955 [Aphelenchoides avenae]|nr:hypothetical protein AAVH_01955 [Aphelenchus avenae]